MARERVLVIDDSADIRSFLQEMVLGPRGYIVTTATDGQSGFEAALAQKPDLILLDVNMPRMTGLEVLEALREHNFSAPVILMTFYGSENIAVQAFRLGVRDYVRKPFEVEEVLAAIDRALTESRLRQERERLMRELAATNQQLQRRITELGTLYAIGQAVAAVLDLEKLLNRVVEAAVYLTRADDGGLFLVDRESGELYLTAAQGFGKTQAQGMRLRVEDSLIGQVIKSGTPLRSSAETGGIDLKVKTGYLVHSILYVPLRIKNQVIGALGVANRVRKYSFTQEDQFRLLALADYAAIAIENARLYEATQEIVAAEILKQTVVTLSHYINNPLTALAMSAQTLAMAVKEGRVQDEAGVIARAVLFTEMKVEEISAVLAILQDLASPKSTTYLGTIKMIDIEQQVKKRLEQIRKKYGA
ncbi:MAG: response regulator [Anaerolineae bacterium]|jgi:two-component system NtrC family sensor kinase|nr:response regulator [Anaerolineae bacterium]MDH7474625.1 response regulator [Anaerolineae bacterium]